MILKNHIVMLKDSNNDKSKFKNSKFGNSNQILNNAEAQNCNGEIKDIIKDEEEIVNFLNDNDNSQNAFFSISMSIQQENVPALFNFDKKFTKPNNHSNKIFTHEIEEIIDDNCSLK